MKTCIYCKKNERETDFSTKRGDEVIPQFLGRFNWFFGSDTICKTCNNKLSKAENIFKEGSIAGIHSSLYNFNNKQSSIRIRKERIKHKASVNGKEIDFFNGVPIPVLLDKNTAHLKPIIIIDHKNSKTRYILFAEKYNMFAKKQEGKEFKKRKKDILKLRERFGKLDIRLLADYKEKWPVKRLSDLLACYGINYREHNRTGFEDTKKNIKIKIDVNYTENGDSETLKTPVKIAFNYFAFCAKKDDYGHTLLSDNFNHIRNYLILSKLPPDKYKPIFAYNDKTIDKKGWHIVSFWEENGFIIGYVSLFSRFNYKVILGKYPFTIRPIKFGCITAFDPFSREIITNTSSTILKINKPGCGLFCR